MIGIATAIALLLRLFQLTRPNYLLGFTGYDDGVDFGSAVRLVDGVIPYRDFVFVQPPGITLLMAPVALVGKLIGTDSAFAVARVLTVCAGAAGVGLVGLLVRHRGILATTVACGIAAVHPDAVYAAHSVLLEPWLVLFCLAGAVLMFDRDELTRSPRRLMLSGIAFGFAGAIKVWAIIPVLVLVALCCTRLDLRRARSYVAGVGAGFATPVIAFLIMAPKPFVTDVLGAQLARTDVSRVPTYQRLTSLAGIGEVPITAAHPWLFSVGIGGLVALSVAGVRFVTRRRLPDLEAFVLWTTGLTLLAFMWPPDYYDHYAGFFAPLLALSLALPGTRLITAAAAHTPRRHWAIRRLQSWAAIVTVLALGAMAAVQFHSETGFRAENPAASVDAIIPTGTCVATDTSSLTLITNRFTSSDPRCSSLIDPVGTAYALAGGRNALSGAARSRSFEAAWLAALRPARFVLLNCFPPSDSACNLTTNRRLPWAGPAGAYFTAHFRKVTGVPEYLFERINAPAG